MKFLRKRWFWLTTIALLVVAFLSLFLPPVQRQIALFYLGKNFDFVSMDRLSIGSRSINVGMLNLEKGAYAFRVKSLKIKWSLWSPLSKKKIDIDDIQADEFSINYLHDCLDMLDSDKQPIEQGKKPIDAENINEILNENLHKILVVANLRIPTSIHIGHIKANGMITWDEKIFSDISIECDDIAPSNTSHIDVASEISFEKFDSSPRECFSANFYGKVEFSQTANGLIHNAKISSNCTFLDCKKDPKIKLDGFLNLTNTDEVYALNGEIVNHDNEQVLSNFDVSLNKHSETLSVGCLCNLRLQDLQILFHEPDLPEYPIGKVREVPKMDVYSCISGELDLKNISGGIDISLKADLDKEITSTFSQYLKSDLSISGGSSFVMRDKSFHLENAEILFCNEDDTLDISLHLTKPLTIWDNEHGLVLSENLSRYGEELLKCNVNHLDLRLIDICKILPSFEYNVTADTSYDFSISFSDGNISVIPSENGGLKLKNITISDEYKNITNTFSLSCLPKINFNTNTGIIVVSAEKIVLNSTNDKNILEGALDADISTKNTNLDHISAFFVSDLYELSQLRVRPNQHEKISGVLSCQIDANDKKKENNELFGKFEINLKNLTSDEYIKPINLGARCTLHKNDKGYKFEIPFTISGMHDSSGYVNASVSEIDINDEMKVDIDVKCEALSLYDIYNIILAVNLDDNDNPSAELDRMYKKKLKADEIRYSESEVNPFFQTTDFDIIGSVTADIDQLYVINSLSFDDLKCRTTLSDRDIKLESLDFFVNGSPCKFFGNLSASRASKKKSWTYAMHANGSTSTIDVSKIVNQVLPQYTDIITGNAIGKLEIESEGESLDELLQNSDISAKISAKNGKIHPFNCLSKEQDLTLNLANVALSFFSDKQDDNFFKNKMYYTSDVKKDVESIKYDNIDIVLKRESDRNIYIEMCDLVGPELFVNISGGTSCLDNFTEIADYPLNIDINIGLSGKLGDDMDKIGLVTYKSDKSRYMQGPRFSIGGTVGNPIYPSTIKLLVSILTSVN